MLLLFCSYVVALPVAVRLAFKLLPLEVHCAPYQRLHPVVRETTCGYFHDCLENFPFDGACDITVNTITNSPFAIQWQCHRLLVLKWYLR